jgi:hypothetical protein
LTVITWSTAHCPKDNTLTIKPAQNGESLFDLKASGRAYANLTAAAAAEIIEALTEVFPEISDPNYYVTTFWDDNPRILVRAGQQDDFNVGSDYASHEEAALDRIRRLFGFEDGYYREFHVKHRGVVKVFKNVSHRGDYVYAIEEVTA